MVDALLQHHRVMHGQRILVEPRLPAVPVALVGELAEARHPEALRRYEVADALRHGQVTEVEADGER
jgi:hypothetical protein